MNDLMLAIDFGGTKVEAALVLPGQIIVGRVRLDTNPDKGAAQVVERALAAGHDLLASHGIASPRGIGVATMGYTREDGVDLAPNVPGWDGLRLPARIREGFLGTPVVIDNDVRAAALAELSWGALRGVSTAVYLNFGTGVAATLVLEGQIVTGAHGCAGEVGYWLVPVAGGHSTLEVEVGGAGVRRRASALGLEAGLAELMASDEPAAAALVDDVFAQIALSVANMALLLDPERIVLGGGYVQSGPRLLGEIRAVLDQHGFFPAEVTVGEFGSDAGLYGAIALAERAAGLPAVAHSPAGHG